ncbi:EamA family transporter [Conexibacter arvalis]|uniref:EamA family transporter n=1 Tax=Conexibacter arvalis TaxID=912552 RepID=UPI00160A39CF
MASGEGGAGTASGGRGAGGAGEVSGAALVLSASLLIQTSSALATSVFKTLGALGTSGLRFAFGALMLAGLLRGGIGRRSRGAWLGIGGMGLSIAGANVGLYCAIDRIPLGTAVAIQFCGPLLVAASRSRRPRDLAWVALAVAGVLLVCGGLALDSLAGAAFALGSAACWAGYLLSARRVGDDSAGLDGLALAVAVSAVVTLPFALDALAREPRPGDLALVALLSLLGVALPYACELIALRRAGLRVVSVLLCLDPAVAALVGLVALGQRLGAAQVAGVALVTVASVGVVVGGPDPAAA